MSKKIVLIDGNSLMFRAYYATAYRGNFMQTTSGLYTNAVYGFYLMINNIVHEEEYRFIAFDAGSQTFRHKSYEDYKGTRKPLPDELRVQIPYVKKYLDVLNVKRLESVDYEADDLIASVANKFYDEFDEIVIISGDKDLLQLVNDKVKVLLPLRGTSEFDEYNKDNFYEKMQIYPNQVIDFKGLVGDTSDNLPGIKGVGEKTAIKLLNEYQSLENIIANTDNLQGKMKENFVEFKDVGLRSKELATLKNDVNLELNKEDLKNEQYNYDELVSFLQELEFNSFLKALDKPKPSKNTEYDLVNNLDFDFSDVLKEESFLNFEVVGKNYLNAEFLGFSIVTKNGKYFVTSEVLENNASLHEYLKNPNYKKIVFDYKLILAILSRYNLNIKGVVFDLIIYAYLVNPSYGVGDFKQVITNFVTNLVDYYDNVYGAKSKLKAPELDVYAKHSVEKGVLLLENWEDIKKQVEQLEMSYLADVEMSLAEMLAVLENEGLKIDVKRLEDIGIDLSERIKLIENEIHYLANEEFNINSPKQLGDILFEKLGLPHGKKNKTGYSTNVDVLEKLADDFAIARKVLEYRGLNKLITTYVNGIRELVDEEGYIHPLYRQTETQTGRLSSMEPNIQNMPVRTEEGQVIREIFISRFKDGKILAADYSQIELRVLAHLSNDPEMVLAFNESIDFHSQTASRLYDVDIKSVSQEMRRMAKAINFGIIYGMSAWGLSETINVSPLEANIYINKYFDTYKQTKVFLDSLIEQAKANGYTKTILNRRRYIPEIQNKNQAIRSFGERTAMNAPIQGSAADIIKVAMVNLKKRMEAEGVKSLMIAQIHDELLFDCLEEEVELMKKIVKEEMEKAYKLRVNLVVGLSVGNNWAEAK